MPRKDIEERKAYQREYRQRNIDKIKQKEKEYRQNNKEKIQEYRENNKEYYKEHRKEYIKTEQGKKSYTISNWKSYGVIHENFDELYELYISTNKCNVCKKVFDENNKKCLDHDHDTGKFRYVLCWSCNTCDFWKIKV
jgi:hypothetical protein